MNQAVARLAERSHRQHIADTHELMDAFIIILQQLGHQGGTYMFSMDLYAAFERFAGKDLPEGFHREFGRRITKACVDGRLPFKRKNKTRARLSAFEGINPKVLESTLSCGSAGALAAGW